MPAAGYFCKCTYRALNGPDESVKLRLTGQIHARPVTVLCRCMPDLISYTPAIPVSEFVDRMYVRPAQPAGQHPAHPAYPLFVMTVPCRMEISSRSTIRGVQAAPLRRPGQPANSVEIGVRFKPYGLFTGFGLPGAVTFSRIIPGEALFDVHSLAGLQAAARAGDAERVVTLAHELLYARLQPNPILYEITEMVDALLAADLSNNAQRELAREFQRSPQSFIALFRKAIGTTPLNYLHICKVHTAKRLLRSAPGLSATGIGHSLGFYDQAHFIRTFRKHTGHTPVQYRRLCSTRPDNSVQF